MSEYQFILEPYKGIASRHVCPSCQKPRTFSRYLDAVTGEPLAEHVGRCNREDNCGYHYNPREFFEEHPSLSSADDWRKLDEIIKPVRSTPELKQPDYIPFELLQSSLKSYQHNHFVHWLLSLFGETITHSLIERFLIGTSKHWPGATVFWQLDQQHCIRAGKVMLYNPATGKRVQKPYNHITWVHTLLSKQKVLSGFNLCQCFFGEYQLSKEPTKPVAIVESEKSAIVASLYMPEYVWLATGGKNGCKWTTIEVYQVLKGRKVMLFPDLNAFDKWAAYAQTLRLAGIEITVSDVLERSATEKDRSNGLDLVDYLVRPDERYGWALTENDYPLFWDNSPFVVNERRTSDKIH